MAGLVYAGLLVLGGLMGFLKKGSKMSLLCVYDYLQLSFRAHGIELVSLPQACSSMVLRYMN